MRKNSSNLKYSDNRQYADQGSTYVPKNRNRGSWDLDINVSSTDRTRLMHFMTSELKFYNGINESFYSILKNMPEVIMLFDKWDKLFGLLAHDNINLRNYINKPTSDQPKYFESFKDLLVGNDTSGKKKLTESMLIVLESLGKPTSIHPEVKKLMATEMLKFYKEQAKIIVQPGNRSNTGDQMFKIAPAFLENLDSIRKRHVQVPKKICQIKWNHETEVSELTTPYNNTPFLIRGINLNEEHWNIAIIHQLPGQIPIINTPWQVSIKNETQGYMIRYQEQNSPYAGNAFFKAKSKN